MWNTIEYATVGKGHLKAGVPCQDKVKTYKNGEVTVVTLADGAGSASLSHLGAEAVLDQISNDLGEHFEEYFAEADAGLIRERLYDGVLEALDRTQKEHRCELKDLSSTLLAVAASGSRYFIAHIGDGVIGYLKDGETRVATGPDNGDFANETVFTTSPTGLSRMRLIKGEDDAISGFVLMSDGTENALYNKKEGTLSSGIRRIMQMTALCSDSALQQMLEESFTTTVTALTVDDCSISVLVKSDAFPNFYEMTRMERLDLLQIDSAARDRGKRVNQAEKILKVTEIGATAGQIAKQIHVKQKHIYGKLERLVALGLLEKDRSIYRSVIYEITTDPNSNIQKERKENIHEK